MPTQMVFSKVGGEAEVLKGSVDLGLQRIPAKEAADMRELSGESHLCSLSLASKAAESVLNDSVFISH